jgi:hypothetical protein
MATAHHTIFQGMLPMPAALLVALLVALSVAQPAAASFNPSDSASAVIDDTLRQAATHDTPQHAISWLEQPMHSPGAIDTSQAIGLATPAALVAGHATHIARLREDLDLSANDSAARRYNLLDEEPLISEHWWQALPGVVVALFLGLALYMRRPIQRKRKYRSTPHQPSGIYSRRGGPR